MMMGLDVMSKYVKRSMQSSRAALVVCNCFASRPAICTHQIICGRAQILRPIVRLINTQLRCSNLKPQLKIMCDLFWLWHWRSGCLFVCCFFPPDDFAYFDWHFRITKSIHNNQKWEPQIMFGNSDVSIVVSALTTYQLYQKHFDEVFEKLRALFESRFCVFFFSSLKFIWPN